MAKWIAVATGFITSSALLYNFQHDIDSNTGEIRKRLRKSQVRLETALPGSWRNIPGEKLFTYKLTSSRRKTPNERPKIPFPTLSQTRNHINQRFIPTFKSTWNEHIASLANRLNNLEIKELGKFARDFTLDQWQK
ncbi:hypothetical protein G9A89_007372 [Geosiphon pyriformis]|nr:hypothetical protein G9A89_007372 [Geosiphon pyriformis]